MIKAGIIGGAGYTAGELIRILLRHPEVEIEFIQSNSQSGKPIHAIHSDLVGDTDIVFSDKIEKGVDVYFICQGHGKSREIIKNNPHILEKKIIDLSRDYRLSEDRESFVYGLPELQKEEIKAAVHIANPGCFATAMQLALLPLAAAGYITNEVHIHGITGSTGAGQKPVATTHFSWRNSNISTYKAFSHQHMDEVHQTVKQLSPQHNSDIHFVPIRGDFTRGIFISAYTRIDASDDEMKKLYQDYYEDHPFTHLASEGIALKSVVNTNKCLLHIAKHGNMLHITSIIDNLLKGASGQATQNMNLIFGLEETTGLDLKSTLF